MKISDNHTTVRFMLHALLQKYRKIIPGRIPELQPLEAYQLWAEKYDDVEGNALLFAERRAIRPIVEKYDLSGKVILDAGCGTGRNLGMLRSAQPRMLVAADLTPNMLERARQKHVGVRNIFFQQARVEQLPYKDGQFDFVLCTLVLGHVTTLLETVRELSRVLAHGASMVTSCFHPYSHEAGWQRTFKAGTSNGKDQLFAVADFHHSPSEYAAAFRTSRCEIVQMREPVIDESLMPFYERAKRIDLYDRFRGSPLLLIFEVRKK